MEFRANAKLMLFGEYLVLKGSKCIAIPLKFNQKADITKNGTSIHKWHSLECGEEWFSATFNSELKIINSSNHPKAAVIQKLLRLISYSKPELFEDGLDFKVHSNFRREWGLGSSSSLISLLAQWSDNDPFELLEKSFNGSGYDVASATAGKPILYEMQNRRTEEVALKEAITSKLLFIYSGRKQSSASAVQEFDQLFVSEEDVQYMNNIVTQSLGSTSIENFETCMDASEDLLGKILQQVKIKDQLFDDYPHSIKSLGAWGGDFFMATFRDKDDAKQYFCKKGFNIQFTYQEIIFH